MEYESYIGVKPCGCLGMAVVDDPEHKKDMARAVAKSLRRGEKVNRVSAQQVGDMPWVCPEHLKKVIKDAD